ncbi:MAG: hypothetical protein ORN27_10935 [Rhodoluna sp.]|nr:hypothetical protein [Rhodoluna sp.]
MQILKRILALAVGSAAAVTIALLAGSSSHTLADRVAKTPTVSTLSVGLRAEAAKVQVGNTVSAPQSAVSLGAAEPRTYRWFACPDGVPAASNALPVGCSEISGARSAELTLTNAEVGKHIMFSMSVGNGPVAFSAATEAAVSPAPTLAAAPVGLNKSLRFVAAGSALNSKISVTRGLWPASGAITSVAYEWLRCSAQVAADVVAPANCAVINGAVGANYSVTANDVGQRIVSHLTVVQGGVTSDIWTSSIGPVYKAIKYIKGAAVTGGVGDYPYLVDHAVTADEGTWDGPPNFTYQWFACTAKVAAAATLNKLCKAIGGATADSFRPTLAQNGKYLMVRISGSTPLATTVVTTFSAGSTKVLDDPSNAVVVALPNGAPVVGNSVALTPGVWTGSPAPTKSYQWYSCDTNELAAGADKPDDCDAITGATGTSFTPTQNLYGRFLLVEEKATSLAGTDSIFSATPLAVASRPLFESDPVVRGISEIGQIFTSFTGTGESSLDDSTTYQWMYCSSASPAVAVKPANCTPIANATESTFTTSRAVEGLFIAVQVTLTNTAGNTTRMSATSDGLIKSSPALDSTDFTPTAAPVVGTAISAPSGSWRGAPAPSFTYQWLVCDTEGGKALLQPSGCSEIAGANSASFTPTHAQASSFLRVRIRANNELGSFEVWSGTSSLVREKAVFIGSPVISGFAVTGTPITVSETSSYGVPTPSTTVAWYQCKTQVLTPAATAPVATNCTVLANQSGYSYTPNNGDLDKFIGAFVTTSNALGTVSYFTATSTKIQGAPTLQNNPGAPGQVGVNPRVFTSISAPAATWVGSPAPVPNYQWYSCADVVFELITSMPDYCSVIQGANSSSFTPTVDEADRYLMVRLGASNLIGSATRFTTTTAIVQQTPIFTVDPTIYGGRYTGDVVRFDGLFYQGSPQPTLTYSWYRCDAAVTTVQATSTCPKIAGATSDNYTLVSADLDKYIAGAATLRSDLGVVTKITTSTVKIQGAPTLVGTLAAPAAGAVKVDTPITMPVSTWFGSPAVDKAFQWFACPTAVPAQLSTISGSCNAISGATGVTFTPTIQQVGKFLVIRTTASNAIGTVVLYSPSTSAVNELPSFQGDTSIDDVSLVGGRVTVTLPTTRGFPNPVPTYTWYRCTAAVPFSATTIPATCAAIANSNNAQYVLDVLDLDKFVAVGVTLTNSSGSATKYSPSTVSIQGVPKLTNALGMPSSTTPAVTAPRIGTIENAPTNVWAGSPRPSVNLQWVRCEDEDQASSFLPVPCDDIPGATGNTYTPVMADRGLTLRVRITATNTLGTTTIWSGSTRKTQLAPSFVAHPALNNFITVGTLVSVNPVSQLATPTAIENYSWYRCPAAVPTASTTAPANCTQILGASLNTYTIQSQDLDNYLVSKVSLTNEAGAVSEYTASTAKIISKPVFDQEPTVGGQSYVTGKLVIMPFTVSAKPTATLTYQWYYCSTRILVNFADVQTPNCNVIAGATSDTFYPTQAQAGTFVSVLVTATNVAGTTTSFSKTTSAILTPPRNLVPQVVTGSTTVGSQLSSDTGTWDPGTNVNFDYKWFACTRQTAASTTISTTDCTVVTGATSATFTTGVAQVGKYMVSEVTAKNFTINVPEYSASTEIIASVPVYTSGMGVTFLAGQASTLGAPRVGYTISATDNQVWAGTPAPSFIYQWFVCGTQRTVADKSFGQDCREINGATTKDFAITPALADDYNLVGKYLGVKVTGSNKAGSDFAYSATSTRTVTVPPQLVTAPEISGYRYVDATLSGTIGTFTGTPTPSQTQAWWQCDSAIPTAVIAQPAGCARLVPTTPTIKLTLAMKGKFITTATISTNDAGTVTVWAPSTVEVTTGAINTVPPTITADLPKVGGTMSANHGVWSGDPALTEASYTYQWYSCEVEIKVASFTLDPAAGCLRVGDAVNTTYQPVRDDAGRFILVSVAGANSNGGSKIFSASTTKVNLAPELIIAPEQTGTAFVSTRQNVSDGTWFGVPNPTYTYQWLLCDSEQSVPPVAKPADCSLITGATSSVYSPLISQVSKYLMVQVTATNIAGSTVAYSVTSADIKSAPVNKTPPTVTIANGTSGLPVANQSTISTTGGTWQGRPSPTYQYQWFSCGFAITASPDEPSADKDCQAVSDVTDVASYSPVTSDRGRFIAVEVYATNIHATVTHWSATSTVVNMAPVADVIPRVAGVAFVQAVVSAAEDTWLAYPAPTKTFQWLSCGELTIPSACSVISGASASTFTIPSSMKDRSLMVRVTATNQFGNSSSYSLTSDKVTTGPVSTSPQVIAGSVSYPSAANAYLTTSDGTWAGDPRPTFTYQWYRCAGTVTKSAFELDSSCSAIDGATSNTYALTDIDPGNALVTGITGTNTFGTSTRFSASTPIVTEKVRLMSPPTLTGSAKIGQAITADEGVWRGFPSPDTTYAWYSCTVATPASPVQIPSANGVGVVPPATCTKIQGAIRSSLEVSDSQLGKMLIFMVTKSNTVDNVLTSVNAYTQSSLPAAQPPQVNKKPVISTTPALPLGTNPKVGTVWSVNADVWKDPQPIKTYQWYRCDAQIATGPNHITATPVDAGCVAISGATNASYTIMAEDSGKFVAVEAIGTNAADTLHEWSNSTLAVLQVPIAIIPPTISGDRQRNRVLTIDQGTWTGSPTPQITYQWYSCKAAVPATSTTPQPATNCSQISGETGATYTQSPAGSDDGKFITATVSGTSGNADPTVYWVTVGAGDATAQAPTVSVLPTLTSLSNVPATVGLTYTIGDDRWIGAPTPVIIYKWYACDAIVLAAGSALPSGCTLIDGQTSQSYTATIALADSRKYLLGSVTATNLAGTATTYTKSLTSIIDKGLLNTTPASVAAPSLLVPTSDASPITGTTGVWSSNNTLQITHQWYACPYALSVANSYVPIDCFTIRAAEVGGQITPLKISQADEVSGMYVALYEKVEQRIDATNWRKVRERLTTTTGQLIEAPSLRTGQGYVAPAVGQDMVVGYSSTATTGAWVAALDTETSYTWRGAQVGTFSYQWFSCTSAQATNVTSGLPSGCNYITTSAGRPTTNVSIVPIEAEIGSFLGVRITATNASGSAIVWTNTSRAVTQEVANINPVSLGSAYIVGDRLTLAGGTQVDWKGAPTPAITVEWFSCTAQHTSAPTSLPADCTLFVNGTQSPNTGLTIPLERSTNTQYIIARVTGVNTAWSSPARTTTVAIYTPTTHRILSRPYINTAVATPYPSQTGTADVGSSLSITAGNWSGSAPITLSGRWFACDNAVGASTLATPADGCTLFKSSTQAVLLTHNQVGKYIVGQMVATNEAGTTYQSAAASVRVLEPPAIVSPPEVKLVDPALASGKNEVGQKLTYTAAAWDGFPTPTASARFYACDTPITSALTAVPGNCALIAGVAGSELTLGDNEAGKYIAVASTATNRTNGGDKTTVSVSATMGPVYRTPYFDTAIAPTVSGQPHVGSTVSFTKTTVKGFETPTSTYNWFICEAPATSVNDAIPAGCSAISDNPNSSLTVPAAAAGKYIMGIQTASATWTPVRVTRSSPTTLQVTASPAVQTAPTVSGDDYVGGTVKVSVNQGVWSSFPTITDNARYSISLYSCTASSAAQATTKPATCGATALSTFTAASPVPYNLTSALDGKFIVAKVTATVATNKSATDSLDYYSASFGPIREAASLPTQPLLTGAGTPDVGGNISLQAVTPGGFPVNNPTYDWYVCPTGGATVPISIPAGCDIQANYSSKVFQIPASAAGKYVFAWVTASNELGSASRATAYSQMVKQAPVNVTAPTLSGGDEVGTPITANFGTWTSTPAPAYTYMWYSCDTATSTVSNGCTSLTGSNSVASYTPGELQAGRYILANVTATTAIWAGNAQAVKATTTLGPIRQPANLKLEPTIGGYAHVGESLTVSLGTGSLVGYPAPSFTYDWYACDTAPAGSLSVIPANCSQIANQPKTALTVDSSVAGKYIIAAVTASNYSTFMRTTRPTLAVTASLANLTAPALSGDSYVGGTAISVGTGTWSSTPAVNPASDLSYAFYACATSTWSASCPAATATNNRVTVTSAMQGKFIFARVTASVAVNKPNTGLVTVTTNGIGPVLAAPTFAGNPTIDGISHVGSVITAISTGELGVPAPAKTYAWYFCNTAVTANTATMPAGCIAADPAIDGQPTITLPAAAAGKFVSVLVTLTNQPGPNVASVSLNSRSGLVVTATPVLSTAPVLSGSDIHATNSTILVTPGVWVTAPSNATQTYNYSWYACPTGSSVIANCAYLKDTNTGSIDTTEAMVDKFIVAKVTVSVPVNKSGTGTAFAYSNFSNRIRKSASFGATPVVTGYMNIGETVTVSDGSPAGVPAPTVAYNWYVCTAAVPATVTAPPASCTLDAAATSNSYLIPNTAGGSYILAIAKASSDQDLATVYRSSVSTVPVSAGAVLGATSPVISGSPILGTTALSVSTGTWTWKPSTLTGAYSYRWFACSSTVSFAGGATRPDTGCTLIANQTASSLTLTNSELGYAILAEVTVTVATNTAVPTKTSYNTALTGVVSSRPTAGATPPSFAYTALTAGSVVTARLGTWSGSPTPVLTYKIFTCAATEPVPTNKLAPATCTLRATNTDLTILSAFKGLKLLLEVTATTNGVGSATNISAYVTIP